MKSYHHFQVTFAAQDSISGFSGYYLDQDPADAKAREMRCKLYGLSFGDRKFDRELIADYGQTG